MEFSKWQGLGNDFILVSKSQVEGRDYALLSRKLCDRHFGIGADGLVILDKVSDHECTMRIFNSDGSEAEMCGNASRCVGRYFLEQKDTSSVTSVPCASRTLNLKTAAGDRLVTWADTSGVSVEMGKAHYEELEIEVGECTFIGMSVFVGNPHFVIFVENMDEVPLEEWGPMIETHLAFPDKTNVEFAQIIDNHHIRMRVWERGCGVTKACGTGSCATAVAACVLRAVESPVCVQLDGGELLIDCDLSNNKIIMTGDARKIYEGTLDLETI